MKLTIKSPLLSEDRTVTLVDGGDGRWEVFDEDGKALGIVRKGTYTYSPPTHRGSRIVRYHHEVKCWKHDRASHRAHWRTRKEAIVDLLLREGD